MNVHPLAPKPFLIVSFPIFKKPISSSIIAIACTACLGLLLGCNEQPQIVTHRIPKSQSKLAGIPPEESTTASAPLPTSPTPTPSSAMPTPDGWTRQKSNPMFPSDKFSKVVDDSEVILSVMPLPSSNDWQSNVVRWLGQVSMEKTTQEITELTTEIEIDGKNSQKIRLFKDDTDSKAIVGAMALKGNTAWFIKLMGTKAAVEATEKDFDDYVKAFKFP